ncbi:NUDIX domain-containing protein [Acinetobacter baumannii]
MSEAFSRSGDVELVQREECFRGFYRLDRLRLRHRQFDGSMGREISRELFVRHDAVCVLPYDPQRDCVVLIEQFLGVGAMQKLANPWLLELVAGLIDKDEQPEEVVYREAMEEAGLTLGGAGPITQYLPSPGGTDEVVHLFVGRCDSEGVGGVHGLPEEGEDIRVHVWPLEDALQAVRDGRINNAASIIALQWLALNRAEVRGLWGRTRCASATGSTWPACRRPVKRTTRGSCACSRTCARHRPRAGSR